VLQPTIILKLTLSQPELTERHQNSKQAILINTKQSSMSDNNLRRSSRRNKKISYKVGDVVEVRIFQTTVVVCRCVTSNVDIVVYSG